MDSAMRRSPGQLPRYRLVLVAGGRARCVPVVEAGQEEDAMNVGHRVLLPALREMALAQRPVVRGSSSCRANRDESVAPESAHARGGRLRAGGVGVMRCT